MASSASTRNLTTNGPMDGRTDSVLNIGLETPTRLATKRRNCDPWKLSLFISVTLLLAAVSVIVYLLIVQRQTPAECQPEIEVQIPGAEKKYTMVKLDKTFDEANDYCQSAGGDLASFSSMSDWLKFAGKLFFLASAEGWAKPMWFGARGNGHAGLRWTDGTPFTFNVTQHSGVAPWYAQDNNMQPNNGFEEGICVYAYVGNGRKPDHSWLDYDCPTAMWFLCENPDSR